VLDEAFGIRLLGGNATLYSMVLKEFFKENIFLIQTIGAQIERGDYQEAAKTAHKVKGSSGSIGAKQLRDTASELQRALEGGGPGIGRVYEDFQEAFNKVMTHIKGI
jgi:HPt (histidine-containing phosphotransfer) domain-containing protein